MWPLFVIWALIIGSAYPPPLPQVPVLCYHNMVPEKHASNPYLFITPTQFREQMKGLRDSGYQSIHPDQLTAYILDGKSLPEKPVLISFDDTRTEHFYVAARILQEFRFRGTFFIMTVCINKPRYLTSHEIKLLADSGHTVAAHTWDHPNLKTASQPDWEKQLSAPRRTLEKITGRPVYHFAYPFGAWNSQVVEQLQKAGYRTAFQLDQAMDPRMPAYTIRRIMVSGDWSATRLQEEMRKRF